jgi:DNA-directed RNA polymerase specialized sigma24 family protein
VETHFGDRPVDWDPANRQTASRVFVVLSRLGTDGQIYSLRVIEGRELSEIAALMELSISTVRRRLARVTKRMERLAANDLWSVPLNADGSDPLHDGTPLAAAAV